MPVRRSADPRNIMQVWDAIRTAEWNNELPSRDKVKEYIANETERSLTVVDCIINQSITDGLVIEDTETKILRVPMQERPKPIDEGKDWYCNECHLGGNVVDCRSCYRVFHADCTNTARNRNYKQRFLLIKTTVRQTDTFKLHQFSKDDCPEEWVQNDDYYLYDTTQCSVCNFLKGDEDAVDCSTEEMNELLKYTHKRLEHWIKPSLTDTLAPEERPEWLSHEELHWRATQFFYNYVDLSVMRRKLEGCEYKRMYEFLADTLVIFHNITIYHGCTSQEVGSANFMLRESIYDMCELVLCLDCFRNSNRQPISKWFCIPCEKPHKVVFAKQKGYPYWPAKVLREAESECDVRWFGGKYERSIISKKFIKSIHLSLKSLQIKRSSAFNKAYEEALLHLRVLDNPEEISTILPGNRSKTPKSKGAVKKMPSNLKTSSDVKTPDAPNTKKFVNSSSNLKSSNATKKYTAANASSNLTAVNASGNLNAVILSSNSKAANPPSNMLAVKKAAQKLIADKKAIATAVAQLDDSVSSKGAETSEESDELSPARTTGTSEILANYGIKNAYVSLQDLKDLSPRTTRNLNVTFQANLTTSSGETKESEEVKSREAIERNGSKEPDGLDEIIELPDDSAEDGVQNTSKKTYEDFTSGMESLENTFEQDEGSLGYDSMQKNDRKRSSSNNVDETPHRKIPKGDDSVLEGNIEFDAQSTPIEIVTRKTGVSGSFHYGEVSSSTEHDPSYAYITDNIESPMHKLDQPYCDAVEKMRRRLMTCTSNDRKELVKIAMECAQAEIDRLTSEHNEAMKKTMENQAALISEIKKKQWCYNCEQDAIYHCCWNTAYCSPGCQQEHWQAEHKKVCRRKR